MYSSAILLSVLSAVPSTEPVSSDTVPAVATVPTVSAVSQGDAAETAPWSGSINFGFTQTTGNTETASISLTADAQREEAKNRYTLKSFFNYAETFSETDDDTIRTARNVGGSAQYDYLAGEKYYYFGTFGVESDEFAMLDLRWYAGAGVGYNFKDTEKMKLDGEAGVVYFAEKFDDGSDSDSIALKLGYNLAYVFSEKTRFTQAFEAFPAIDDFSDVFVRVDSRLVSNLTESMLGSIQYVVDWDNTPAAGADSTDQRIVVSLGWAFGK